MNYQKLYNSLIERAKTRTLEGYCETHHILPRCMGGTDDKTNLVDLTPEEHFLCHQLLVKIHKDTSHYYKLVFACRLITSNAKKYKPDSKLSKLKEYGWIKREFAKAVSTRHTGKTVSEETRKKISAARTGKPSHMLGKESPWTSDRNRKLKGSSRVLTEEHRINLIAAISKPRSEEVKAKISASKTGVPRKKLQCPHCGRLSGEGNYTRWHGDNCRNKANI